MQIEKDPDESIELGSIVIETGGNPNASVIWLHGLGADGSDFEPIVSQLMLPAAMSVRFVFPDAPLRPVTINGGYMMRAWYDIYEDISQEAEQDESGIGESAHIVTLLVEQEIERGIDSNRVVLAGFSQGGAVALYAGLNSRLPIGGVMALSAYLPLASNFSAANSYQARVPSIFMAHGTGDAVVPFRYGEASMQLLRELGLSVEWNSYAMGHSVCGDELMAIREWLIERFG